jgi:hypothetical protein
VVAVAVDLVTVAVVVVAQFFIKNALQLLLAQFIILP